MSRNGGRPADDPRDAALSELRERAEEIRDAVRVRVLSAGNLRHAAESASESPEDVAQTVFLKLWAQLRDGDPEAISDLKAYAKKMADNHIASLLRRPIVSRTDVAEPDTLDRLSPGSAQSSNPEEAVEHSLSAAQVASIVADLSHSQRVLLTMRTDLGMTVAEMARVVGQSQKSCAKQLERAIEKVRVELAASEDLDAADRRRLSRVMAAKRWGTPALVAGLQRDMRGDLRLASLWRQSNGAMHDVAGAVVVDESLRHLEAGPGLTDRAISVIDRGREALAATLARGGPEQEAAAGAAAGSASVGLVTKAVVAACIAGPAAGGACVATGVVELPNRQKETPAVEVEEVRPPTEELPDAAPPGGAQPDAEQQPGEGTAAAVEPPPKPTQQINQQLSFEQTAPSASSTSGGGRSEFGGPSGGGGGGGSGGGGEGFGIEK